MTVRAKFKYTGYEASQYQRQIDPSQPWGSGNIETVEMRTLKFNPVYGQGDPNHENTKFWSASPCGEIRLGTVNPEAWSQFELGKEYYLDFSPAAA